MVVDAVNGKPLSDAVVTVVWVRKPFLSMNGYEYFQRADETLTDVNGKFSLASSPGIDLNPLTYVLDQPIIVIFKPGYGPFPYEQSSPRYIVESGKKRLLDYSELNKALANGAVVKLTTMTREKLKQKYTYPGSMLRTGEIPRERIPNLMRLINLQNRELGLPAYPGY